ncbi:hypothetical protein IHN32_13500, partial [Deinococcus sp. 14RED07]|nr:hypothetical protein [Deinococcus sp. 14RED07]
MTAADRNEQIRGALGGAAVGAALGVLAAFLGEVRVGTPLLWVLLVLGALAGA